MEAANTSLERVCRGVTRSLMVAFVAYFENDDGADNSIRAVGERVLFLKGVARASAKFKM